MKLLAALLGFQLLWRAADSAYILLLPIIIDDEILF